MGLENRYKMEYRPLPSSGLSVVIADDKTPFLRRTEKSLREVLGQINITPGPIYQSETITDLFDQTFHGKDGNPVDMVILDDNYGANEENWTLSAQAIVEQAQKLDVDLRAYITNSKNRGERLAALIDAPNGVNLSILLRLMGFEGNIFISSTMPPDLETLGGKMGEVARAVPQYTPRYFPVDGVIIKDFELSQEGSQWAREFAEGPYWNMQSTPAYTQALLGLLTYKPSAMKAL